MGHDHSHPAMNYGRAFALGIGLNVLYVAVEVFYGFFVNSSALLADAGHNAGDVFSLVLAWVATSVAEKGAGGKYTYGFRKTTIMASLINGLLIFAAAGLILWDAIQKIQAPVEVPGGTVMIVAGVGVVVNTLTALLFMKGQKDDLNVKGAFLHMAADAAVSVGVVLGGLAMSLTGKYWIDPALSFVIVAVIVYSAWGLLRDSVKLALDGVPKDIHLDNVQVFLENLDGVEEVHDLHVWALSTTENALTAHLVVPGEHDDQFIFRIRDKLHEQFNIGHSTLQIEKTFEDDEYRHHKV